MGFLAPTSSALVLPSGSGVADAERRLAIATLAGGRRLALRVVHRHHDATWLDIRIGEDGPTVPAGPETAVGGRLVGQLAWIEEQIERRSHNPGGRSAAETFNFTGTVTLLPRTAWMLESIEY